VNTIAAKFLKVFLAVVLFGGLYLVAVAKHDERDRIRQTAVELTPDCKAKLEAYGLAAGPVYRSPYLVRVGGEAVEVSGYSEEDVRAIQRGCNIIDDLQGFVAGGEGLGQRWNATRFVRGTHTTCSHCHQNAGDKQDEKGNRIQGSNNLGASWVMADMYDRFTGLILSHELRQMQCYINSSNGFKPNIADDLLRDVTAYSRFIAAALDLKIGNRYLEQGMDEIPASATNRRGDDYVRGAHIYREQCASCHGQQGFGLVQDGRVIYPAVAGRNSFSLDSRMNFAAVNTIMPGFICRNMPPGAEGTLEGQDCRDIAYFLSTLPRPAGDLQGPLYAVWQQLMMIVMPPLTAYADSLRSSSPRPVAH
jgi:thiosulfate dehydrogenase